MLTAAAKCEFESVATVAVDSAANAAYLAASILSTSDDRLAAELDAYRKGLGHD